MAELTPFIVQQELARVSAGGRAGGRSGTRLPGISGTVGDQGLDELGRQISRLGAQLSQTEGRFAQAKAGVLSVEALTSILDEMQQVETDILQDSSIFPTDRADAFRQRIEPRIGQVRESVPTLGQDSFLRGAQSSFLRIERGLRDEGRAESVTRGRQAAEAILGQLGEGILTADNEVDQQSILQDARVILSNLEQQGFLEAGEGEARLQAFRQVAALTDTELLIRQDPDMMLEQLLEGPEANPQIPPTEIPRLIDVAQAERREQLNFQEQRQRIDDRDETERQNENASQLRELLYNPDASSSQWRALIGRANAMARDRDLGEEDHAQILATARSFIETEARQGTLSDPQVRATATIAVYRDKTPQERTALRENIERHVTARNLSVTDAAPLLSHLQQGQRRDHYTAIPTYKEGRGLIRQAVSLATLSGLLTGFALYEASTAEGQRERQEQLEAKTAQALEEYSRIMDDIWQNQGWNAAQEQALDVANRVINNFAIQPELGLDVFPQSRFLEGEQGTNVQQRYDEAITKVEQAFAHGDIGRREYELELQRLDNREVLEEAIEKVRREESLAPPAPAEEQKKGFMGRLLEDLKNRFKSGDDDRRLN